MIDKVYLDASFLIALQYAEDDFHQEAVQKLAKMKGTTPVLSLFAVDETLFILRKLGFTKEEIFFAFEQNILSLDRLEIVHSEGGVEHIHFYLNLWKKEKLKPTDAVHLFLIKNAGIKKIATFDADFIDRQKEFNIKII